MPVHCFTLFLIIGALLPFSSPTLAAADSAEPNLGAAWLTSEDTTAASRWLNGQRELFGAPPVVLDEELSGPAQMHAQYLVANRGSQAIEGLRAHDEDLTLPKSSKAGRSAARASNLVPAAVSTLDALQLLMAVVLTRSGGRFR